MITPALMAPSIMVRQIVLRASREMGLHLALTSTGRCSGFIGVGMSLAFQMRAAVARGLPYCSEAW